MVAAAFPLVKIGALAIRQLSKPLAKRIQDRAKKSPFFRNYICMPPAQFYHWCEVTLKMKLLNIGKAGTVKKLNEAAAIELGAEILGEFIVFGTGTIVLTAEYIRQARKYDRELAEEEERRADVERRLQELERITDEQRAVIKSLERFAHAAGPKVKISYQSTNLATMSPKLNNNTVKLEHISTSSDKQPASAVISTPPRITFNNTDKDKTDSSKAEAVKEPPKK